MANKLFLICATLALCFLLTNASIYRTVVEFDKDDATNPIPRQKCQREFRASQHLRACQQLMRKQMSQSHGGGPTLDDDEFDFENDIENTQGYPVLMKCCIELHQEDPVCVCPTLKEAARAITFQGQQQRPLQAMQVYQTAKNLPKICNVRQVGVCPFKIDLEGDIPFVPSYY